VKRRFCTFIVSERLSFPISNVWKGSRPPLTATPVADWTAAARRPASNSGSRVRRAGSTT
jgi:hypothetical protein